MGHHQRRTQVFQRLFRPPIGRGTCALLMLLAGVVQTAWTAENTVLLPGKSRNSASMMDRSHCSVCARYSRSAFQVQVLHPNPWISDLMSRRVKEKLRSGLELARKRLVENHECHDLFTRLGADGIDKLAEALYYPANPYRELHVCKRAVAYLKMGGSETWLCRGFSDLSDSQAAMTLIHETLHQAGLGEYPRGPSSAGINAMVKRACGL